MKIMVKRSENEELDNFVAVCFEAEFPDHDVSISEQPVFEQIQTDDYENEDRICQLVKSFCDKYFRL